MKNCPRQLVMQSCAMCWCVKCGSSNQIIKNKNRNVIQVDASNAFNSINRQVLLHNVEIVCPEVANYIINCYTLPARLFITGGKELLSKKCTSQGDPVAMGMYVIGLMPILTMLMQNVNDLIQVAIAYDLIPEVT